MAGLYWSLGSISMATAIASNAYGYHSGQLTEIQRDKWKNAVNV
jgi:hypothetical protein